MTRKTACVVLLCLFLVIASIITISFAWLGLDQNTIVTHISGKLVTEYFHCGSGTEDDPFVITRPIHYYHMVEFFQRLTNLPVVVYGQGNNQQVVKFGEEYLYFQIGCPEEQLHDPSLRPEVDENTEYYVFDYDSIGTLIMDEDDPEKGAKSKTLNMAYYGGEMSLMPVGTSEIPFVGQLDGKGITVSNLNIVTTSTVDVHTYDENGVSTGTITGVDRYTCDVGIFGYVGAEGTPHGESEAIPTAIKNVYFDNVNIDLSGLNASSITSLVDGQTHTNTEDIHNSETCYAGYIAGHIALSTTVEDVYINHATFSGGAAATIGFGYFGCVEDVEGDPVTTLGSEVTTLRAKGDDAGFGGSIDMKKLHERLLSIWTNGAAQQSNYISDEIVIIDEVNGTYESRNNGTSAMTYPSGSSGNTTVNARYRYYSTLKAGRYFYFNRTDMESTGYNFMAMYGESSRYPKTVTKYTYKNEFSDAWIIKAGNSYLTVSGTNLTSTNNVENASKWIVDESGHLYTVVETSNSFINYYLNRNGTTGVTLSTTANTVWYFSTSENDSFSSYLYTVYNATNYYLEYNEGWSITTHDTYYTISDGQGHYLTGNTTSVSSVSDALDSVKWYLSDPNGLTTTISTVINGTQYYLSGDGLLSMKTASTTWNKDGNKYYVTVQGIDYYLKYDNGWVVIPETGKKISDGNGHYLSAENTSSIVDSTESSAVVWQFSSESNITQIFTIINGQRNYLTYNNGIALTTTATTWNKNGNSFYITVGGKDYYLEYDNGWIAVSLTYYTIGDGNNHYLRVTGSNSFTNSTLSDATHFYFSNENGSSSSGTVYCYVNGVQYYLRNSNGTLQTSGTSNATTWTNDGNGKIKPSGTIYELGYSDGWKLIDTSSFWTISTSNGTYLNANGTSGFTTSGNPTHWNYSDRKISIVSGNSTYYIRVNNAGCNGASLGLSTTDSDNTWRADNNNKYYMTSGNSTYYLRLNNSTWGITTSANEATSLNIAENNLSGIAFLTTNIIQAPSVQIDEMIGVGTDITKQLNDGKVDFTKSSYQTVTKEVLTGQRGGYQTYFPIRTSVSGDDDYDSNDPYKVSNKNTGYIISAANIEDTNEDNFQKIMGDIRISYFPIAKINGSYVTTGLTVSRICYSNNNNNNYLTLSKDGDNIVISNTSLESSSVFWEYSNNKLSTLYQGTRYYLTVSNNSLTLSKTTGVDWTYSNNELSYNGSYIRYSNGSWSLGNSQSLSLSLGTVNTIYTYDDSGNHELNESQKTDVYKQALLQLTESLVGSSSVYGLHFMDSSISTNHLVKAQYVSIFGQEYRNYELPEDSIDFHVIERGSISFFAGEYFTNNNAFFSLHQVFRYTQNDANNMPDGKKIGDIKAINEIIEVYKHSTLGDKTNYIYKYSDNTYSNEDGSYTGASTLDNDYNSTPVFKTSWIKNPEITSAGNKVYFFEIPANAGEYCLGSVSGKTGAYLIYLDIAANGGDSIASSISAEGNDVANRFKVEFRDTPDSMDHAVLQFAIDAPGNVTASDFSITVSFDKTNNTSPHTGGMYTINIVNLTGEDLTLYVYLCDDDYDLMTSFPYAYQVIYTNANRDGVTLTTQYGSTFQIMAGFSIPASGDALEINYH